MLDYYCKRRHEREVVHGLLTFLGRHVLYQKYPEADLKFVREIQKRLRDDLERLSSKSETPWSVREMYEACLGFSARIDSSGETELLSNKWVGRIYRRALGDALIRLGGIVNSRMDKRYEECGLEKLPRMKASEKDQRKPTPWRKAFSKYGSYLVNKLGPWGHYRAVRKRFE